MNDDLKAARARIIIVCICGAIFYGAVIWTALSL
jgi:hypothetical protein